MNQITSYLVYAFVGLNIGLALRQTFKHPHHLKLTLTSWRPTHVLYAIPVLALVILASSALYSLGGPFTWSWLQLFGSQGTNVFGQSMASSWLILIALVVVMPQMARAEELVFRSKIEQFHWRGKIIMAVCFGLIHMVVGVSLATGLAITIAGLYYNIIYLNQYKAALAKFTTSEKWSNLSQKRMREMSQEVGVYASTAAHVTYNYLVVAIIIATKLI